MKQKDLIDTDGENRAVRAFLLGREVGCKDYEQMRRHMTNSGFDNCWPSEFASLGGHMSKAAQQMWLRHLFALERFGAGDGEPVARLMKWIGKGVYPKKGYTVARTYEECPKDAYPNDWEENQELYTHPSPTDLRDAYYEGFMASGEGWNGEYPFQDGGKDPRLDGHWCQTRDNAIEALKGST